MPEWGELVTTVTDFVAQYMSIIAAGAVVGLIAWGGKKILKMGH